MTIAHKSGTHPTAVLGIVAALQQEIKPLTNKHIPFRTPVKIAEQVMLIVSGMGPQQASDAAQQLLQQGATALLSWGTAAALDPTLDSGTLYIPTSVVDIDGTAYPTDERWRSQLLSELTDTVELACGDLTTNASVITTPAEKQLIFKHNGCRALDMESAAIAAQAQSGGLPFVAIRAIVDSADMTLPHSVLTAVDSDGKPNIIKLLVSLLFHPQDWRPLIRLSKGFGLAQNALNGAIKRLGVKLALPNS